MKRIICFIFINIFLFAASAFACDYCLLTQGISPLETSKGIGLRVDQRYTLLSKLYHDGELVSNDNDLSESHWTTQFTGFYSLNSRVTLLAVVPFVRRTESGEGDHHGDDDHDDEHDHDGGYRLAKAIHFDKTRNGGDEVGKSTGIGDIALLGRYQVYMRHSLSSTFVTAVQAGIKLPTGGTNAKNDEGEILDAHIQPGTGAFNYLIGFSSSYAAKRFTFVANGVYSIAGEGEVGDDTYQFGNSINYDAALRYRLTPTSQSSGNIFASFGVAGEYRKKEKQEGHFLNGTGGNTLYIAPGLQLFFHSWIVEFSFWQAASHNLNGDQLGENFKSFVGINYLFR